MKQNYINTKKQSHSSSLLIAKFFFSFSNSALYSFRAIKGKIYIALHPTFLGLDFFTDEGLFWLNIGLFVY
jgi:hypothetical protein